MEAPSPLLLLAVVLGLTLFAALAKRPDSLALCMRLEMEEPSPLLLVGAASQWQSFAGQAVRASCQLLSRRLVEEGPALWSQAVRRSACPQMAQQATPARG